MPRSPTPLLAAVLLSAICVGPLASCVVGEDPASEPHEEVVLALEADALALELATSPSRSVHAPFRRLGVLVDLAPGQAADGALELATSPNGLTWSAWRAPTLAEVDAEADGARSGVLELDAPATYVRVRGRAGALLFLRVETLAERQDSAEPEGDDPDILAATVPIPGVTIRPRSDWGARASRCTTRLSPSRITLHHTDTPNADDLSIPARLRQIQRYHVGTRGYCDVGYHYLISRDGQIWEGRPVGRLGAHTGGANTGNVGVALLGSFERTPPTAAQQAAAARLLRGLGNRYGITVSRARVKGHRELGTTATACPGDRMFGLLGAIVSAAR